MNANLKNNQDFLAEKFRLLDNHIAHASKIALLKIQSWKYAEAHPEVGALYAAAAKEMVKESLLSIVPNAHILCEEGFFFEAIEN